ncbi:hypothetical protein KTG01_16585, partial [Parabacteroides merdae]|nr:hypothetical protein [Parabacteroides merdae]MCQ5195587.1 hypothetical protein [Parabacteroides merdae]
HANVPCRLLLYGENEFLLSSFFDDKAKYSCLNNNGSIAETLTGNLVLFDDIDQVLQTLQRTLSISFSHRDEVIKIEYVHK